MISKRSKRLRSAMGGHARAKHSARKKLADALATREDLSAALLEAVKQRDYYKRLLQKIRLISMGTLALVAFIVVTPRVASAETYKFVDGAPTTHANRCASPSAVKRLVDWAALGRLTLGHDQATLVVGDSKSYGADELAPPYARFVITEQLTVITWIDPIDCSRADCSRLRASIAIIQRFGDAVCYERWIGNAEILK